MLRETKLAKERRKDSGAENSLQCLDGKRGELPVNRPSPGASRVKVGDLALANPQAAGWIVEDVMSEDDDF